MKSLIFYLTAETEPDSMGRQRFVLDWQDPDGPWRPEPSVEGDGPVGRRRGQFFFAVVDEYVRLLEGDGHKVVRGRAPWRI